MALAMGEWNEQRDTQCVDAYPTGLSTARVTVRSNAESMTEREAHGRELAKRAAPDNGLNAEAHLYSQFASGGYTYMTFVVIWA